MTLRDLIGEDPAELASWLRARRPAHGLTILREALGDDGDTPRGRRVPEPQTEPEPLSDKRRRRRRGHTGHRVAAGRRNQNRRNGIGRPRRAPQACRDLRGHRIGQDGADPTPGGGVRPAGRVFHRPRPQQRLVPSRHGWPERPNGWRRSDDARATDYLDNTEVVDLDTAEGRGTTAGIPAAARLSERRRRRGRVHRSRRVRRRSTRTAGVDIGSRPRRPTERERCCEKRCSVWARARTDAPRLRRHAQRSARRRQRSGRCAARSPPTSRRICEPRWSTIRCSAARARHSTPACCSLRPLATGPGFRSSAWSACRPTSSARASSTNCRWRCSRGSSATRPATNRSAACW